MDAGGFMPEKDFLDVFDKEAESCVAAPGPLPKAGTDPTCFDAAAEGAAAVCLLCDRSPAGADDGLLVSCGVVEGLFETVVAAPGPSPNAGTDPTCFEAVDGAGAPSLCCPSGGVTGKVVPAAAEVELRKRGLSWPLYRTRPAATVLDSTASSTNGGRCMVNEIGQEGKSEVSRDCLEIEDD